MPEVRGVDWEWRLARAVSSTTFGTVMKLKKLKQKKVETFKITSWAKLVGWDGYTVKRKDPEQQKVNAQCRHAMLLAS